MQGLRQTISIAGEKRPAPVWIIGPDVIEDEKSTLEMAHDLAELARARGLTLVFKASYEKANRTSVKSYRGPGLTSGLKTLARVREETGLWVLSDVHSVSQVDAAQEVLDVLQIPAFLCRQNDLLESAAATGKVVNLKKGQFLSPWDVTHRVAACQGAGDIWITERGASFGYQRLVNDFRVVPLTQKTGAACIFDATHSVQTPSAAGGSSGGERQFIPVLARAAAAAGADGFFLEVHPEPERALCDGPNAVPLERLPALLDQLLPLTQLVRDLPDAEFT
ncbi:MAG: 3-deoxy-8-phosphooctulonate synthase [Planctomycetota bacterium]